MRLQILFIAMLLAVMAAFSPARAQVQVSARVDRTAITAGESFQLEVRISGGEGEPDMSALTDFKVLSQSTSTSVQIINSRMTREVTYNNVLAPLKKGKLTIPPLTVMVDGKPYKTKPIVMNITDRPQDDPAGASRERDLWVTAAVSESAPYVGQEIIYTFRLFVGVRIDDAGFQAPEFKGFTTKKIEDRKTYRKIINGREYAVTEVFISLTPLDEGSYTIDPAVLNVGVIQQGRRSRRSPFDNFFNRNIVRPRILQTEPIEVVARALPPLPAPQKFSGLVGSFEISVDIENTELKVGDSATLSVTLQGQGNIMDARPPEVILPDAFKQYTDSPEEKITTSPTGTKGKKIFRTALVPMDAGQFTIAPIDFVYFDVEKAAYQTLQAQVPGINVSASATAQAEPLTVTPGPLTQLKKRVAFTGRDILPPKESVGAISSQGPMGWLLFLAGVALPALAFGCAEVILRLRRPQTSAAAIMKTKARQALKQATADEGQDFLTALYQALTAAILAAAGRTGEALTWKEAESLLLENDIPQEEATAAAKLLSSIESYKFSGMHLEADQSRELLNQTKKMVRKLAP